MGRPGGNEVWFGVDLVRAAPGELDAFFEACGEVKRGWNNTPLKQMERDAKAWHEKHDSELKRAAPETEDAPETKKRRV